MTESASTQGWRHLVQRLMWTVIVLAVVIGGLVVNKIQSNAAVAKATTQATNARNDEREAKAAAATAQATANCLNKVLADRNQPTVDETNALVAFATADSAFKSALGLVLLDAKAKQPGAYAVFIKALTAAETEGTVFVKALYKVMAARDHAPLGAC